MMYQFPQKMRSENLNKTKIKMSEYAKDYQPPNEAKMKELTKICLEFREAASIFIDKLRKSGEPDSLIMDNILYNCLECTMDEDLDVSIAEVVGILEIHKVKSCNTLS